MRQVRQGVPQRAYADQPSTADAHSSRSCCGAISRSTAATRRPPVSSTLSSAIRSGALRCGSTPALFQPIPVSLLLESVHPRRRLCQSRASCPSSAGGRAARLRLSALPEDLSVGASIPIRSAAGAALIGRVADGAITWWSTATRTRRTRRSAATSAPASSSRRRRCGSTSA